MNEPTFDSDGYPSEETLTRIEKWPETDIGGLFAFVQRAWKYEDRFTRKGRTFRMSTGGWSGNESLIAALKGNYIAWSLCWESSHRGGNYVFKLPQFVKVGSLTARR